MYSLLLRVVGRRLFCLRFVVVVFLVVGGDGDTSDGPVIKVREGLTRGGTGGPFVKRIGVAGAGVTVGTLDGTTANVGGSSPFN